MESEHEGVKMRGGKAKSAALVMPRSLVSSCCRGVKKLSLGRSLSDLGRETALEAGGLVLVNGIGLGSLVRCGSQAVVHLLGTFGVALGNRLHDTLFQSLDPVLLGLVARSAHLGPADIFL